MVNRSGGEESAFELASVGHFAQADADLRAAVLSRTGQAAPGATGARSRGVDRGDLKSRPAKRRSGVIATTLLFLLIVFMFVGGAANAQLDSSPQSAASAAALSRSCMPSNTLQSHVQGSDRDRDSAGIGSFEMCPIRRVE